MSKEAKASSTISREPRDAKEVRNAAKRGEREDGRLQERAKASPKLTSTTTTSTSTSRKPRTGESSQTNDDEDRGKAFKLIS